MDRTFEAQVAATVAAAGKRGFPREREGIWIVEVDGRHAGSVALTDEGDGLATLRWVVLDPDLRGHGLGRGLISEVVASAESFGYETIGLETFSELRAAARIYRSVGFQVVWEQSGPRWGRDEITYQRYELSFQVARPVLEPAEHGLERAALLRQRVGDPGGRAVVDGALDQPGALELAQAARQQPVGEARNGDR